LDLKEGKDKKFIPPAKPKDPTWNFLTQPQATISFLLKKVILP
jgi:hypothetical protein